MTDKHTYSELILEDCEYSLDGDERIYRKKLFTLVRGVFKKYTVRGYQKLLNSEETTWLIKIFEECGLIDQISPIGGPRDELRNAFTDILEFVKESQ